METEHNQAHEIEFLLPWYLSGALGGDEAREVERHIGECENCRAEAAEWRKLKGDVRSAVEARPAPPPELFQRVMARVETYEPARRGAAGSQARGWEKIAQRFFDLFPARLAPAIALSLIVIQFAALGAMGALLYRAETREEFRTLTGPEVGSAVSEGGVRLRVAFAETATERDIRNLLQEIQGRIVEGPSPESIYQIRIPKSANVEAVVRELGAKSSVIRFAEIVKR